MAHKKTFFLLIIMVVLAGILFLAQIRRTKQITVTRNPVALISEQAAPIPVFENDPILGNPGAAITVMEFMDFSCEKCLALHNTIKNFALSHPQEIRLVWKDAPQAKFFTKDTALANRVGWCISQQDQKKFWQFVDIAVQNTDSLNESNLTSIAQGLNIDLEKLWQCANDTTAKQKMDESVQLMTSFGMKSLPIIFVNNKLINTRQDINLQEMLESFIKK